MAEQLARTQWDEQSRVHKVLGEVEAGSAGGGGAVRSPRASPSGPRIRDLAPRSAGSFPGLMVGSRHGLHGVLEERLDAQQKVGWGWEWNP